MSVCNAAWVESVGWVQPAAGAGITEIVAADATTEVTNGTGPTASLRTVYAPPHAVAATTPGVSHTTATLPGATPTWATSFTYLSLGSMGSPVAFPAGTYKIEFSTSAQGTSNNSELWTQIFINGVTAEVFIDPDFIPINFPVGKAAATVPTTAIIASFVVPSPTSFWFDMHVALGGGAGSVKYFTAYFAVWRVA